MNAGAWRTYAAVAAGGALGSMARHGVALALPASAFPWATLGVNIAGSFAVGLYAGLSVPGGRLPGDAILRHFVVAGFCGGFTTMSIFSLEALRHATTGAPGTAATYVAVSLVTWLAAAWAGNRHGHRLNRRSRTA